MAIEKPSWLRAALESGWLNWDRGDWVDWWIVVIPPFSFTPGKWIETALDWLLGPVNYIWDRIIGAWNELGKIWNIIIDQLGKVWNWFVDIGKWAAGLLIDVYRWVEGQVLDAVNTVKTWFTETIPGYFADFGKVVKGWLKTLTDTWNTTIAAFKPILDFWTYFGKRATDFFNDPVGWFAAVFGAGFALFLQTAGWPFLRVIEGFLGRIWDEEE